MKPHSEKFLKQRRFYMVLPLLVLPFLTMIFWALGGGQGTPVKAEELKSGLNLNLPDAHFEKENELWDKFTLYELAKRDSLKYDEARRNDPYYVVQRLKGTDSMDTVPDKDKLNTSLGTKEKYAQINDQEVIIQRKLEQLTKQLTKSQLAPDQSIKEHDIVNQQYKNESGDVDRLEQMMQQMTSPKVNDPEMQQIEGVLEKILDIQHPDRLNEKIKSNSKLHEGQVFAVQSAGDADDIGIVQGKSYPLDTVLNVQGLLPIAVQNSFYGLDDETEKKTANQNAIQAVIHETQTIVAGATIKMRLLSDVYINGQFIPKDQFIYGTSSITGERLVITINSIRDEHSLFPVSLKVFDLDGLEGIYIPGAITRDAAKQASSQSIQDMQLLSMDNSLGMQAATAGIEAAKGLFSKKAKLIKITIKAGYQILLKDTNQTKS